MCLTYPFFVFSFLFLTFFALSSSNMLGCVPGDPPYEDYIVTLSAEYAWNRDAPDWGWLHPVIVGGVTYYRSWFECDNRKFAWFQTPSVDEVLNSFAIPYVNGGTNIGGKFAKTVTLKSGQEVAAPINIVIGEAEIRIWTLSETNLPWETLSGKEQREAIIKVIKGRELAGCFGTSRSWVLPHSNDLHHGNFILEMYKRGISVINAPHDTTEEEYSQQRYESPIQNKYSGKASGGEEYDNYYKNSETENLYSQSPNTDEEQHSQWRDYVDGSLGECIQADAGGGEDLSQNDIKEIRHQSEDGVADAPYYQLGMSRKITIRFESMRYRLEGPKGVMISSEELNDAAREAYRKRKQLKCPQVSRSPVLESRKDGPFSLEIYKAGMMKEVGDFPPRKGFTPLHSFRYSLYDYAGTHLSDRAWCLCDKFTQPEWAEAIEINDIKFPHKQFRVTSATPRENIFGFRDICFNFGTISPQDEEYNLSPEEVKLVVSKITGAWKLSCKGTAPCWVFPDHTGLDVDRGIYFEVYKNVATPNREGRYPHAGCYGSDNYDRSQPHKSSRKFPQGFYPYSYKDSGAYEAHQPHNSQYRTEHYNGGYPAHYVKPTAYTGRAPTVANPHPNNPASGYSSHNLNDPMLFESFNGRKNMRESLLTSGDYVRRGTRQARSRSRHKFQGYSHDNYEEPYASGRRSSSHPRESVNYVSPRGGITQRRPRSRSRPAHQDEGYDHDERRHTSYAAPKRESYPESDPLYVYVNVDTPQPRGRSKSRHGQGMYG